MSDIVTTRIFTDGEKGITATKMNDIIGGSSIQTSFVSGQPVASSTVTGDSLLLLKAAGTYAKIDSSAFASSMVPLLPDPNTNIWLQRLRSFNSVGNPNFEVDQRTGGAGIASPTSGVFIQDRWTQLYTGTLRFTAQPVTTGVVLPGTSYLITRAFLSTTVTTQQTTLAAGDMMFYSQVVEGTRMRELINDVHSFSILVRSSVANLKFAVALRDFSSGGATTRSLVKLCTIPTANTWTLIQMPNLPIWAAGGVFGLIPGSPGYQLAICLAAGSTYVAPAADTWQTGNYLGAPGMDNFFSKPVSTSSFDMAFIQHEPGSLCSTLMDKSWIENLQECQRYFTKSYDYGTKAGTVTSNGQVGSTAPAGVHPWNYVPFKKVMAKVPTHTGYSPATGASNNVRDLGGGLDRAISGIQGLGDAGYNGLTLATLNAGVAAYAWHYTADVAW